jgi:hypothetical protein
VVPFFDRIALLLGVMGWEYTFPDQAAYRPVPSVPQSMDVRYFGTFIKRPPFSLHFWAGHRYLLDLKVFGFQKFIQFTGLRPELFQNG